MLSGCMWPVIYIFGQRFSRFLVLPFAAVIGTVGYYVERKFLSKQKPIPYLDQSVQDQREQRLARGELSVQVANLPPNTLGILKPRPVDD